MSAHLWQVSHALDDPEDFDHVSPWLQQVERDTHTEHPVEGVLEKVRSREMTLYAAVVDKQVKALAGVYMLRFKNGDQVARFAFCVGQERETWQHLMPELLERLKSQGCNRMDGCFRAGWERALKPFGFRRTHTYLERSIDNVEQ